MTSKTKLVWHYTNGLVIEDILQSGVILLATAGLEAGERAAAWFSTNPTWEHSANRGNVYWDKGSVEDIDPGRPTTLKTKDMKIEPFDPAKMDRDFKGRFRIGVAAEAAPHSWTNFKRLSGIKSELIRQFEIQTGFGNPYEWRASFSPVGKEYWQTVEQLHHGIWLPYGDQSSAPLRSALS